MMIEPVKNQDGEIVDESLWGGVVRPLVIGMLSFEQWTSLDRIVEETRLGESSVLYTLRALRADGWLESRPDGDVRMLREPKTLAKRVLVRRALSQAWQSTDELMEKVGEHMTREQLLHQLRRLPNVQRRKDPMDRHRAHWRRRRDELPREEDPEELAVLAAMERLVRWPTPKIAERAGLSVQKTLAILRRLNDRGVVKRWPYRPAEWNIIR